MRAPLTVALGPAGAGKTQWTIERFAEAGGRALLIVSSPDQADSHIQRIARRIERPESDVRGAVFSFASLVREIAKNAPEDGCRLIGRAFQRLALADLLPRTIRPDDYLGRMLPAPGFVGALAERIREWKRAALTPDTLEAAALAAAPLLGDPAFPRKTAELVRLFRAYEAFLTRNRLRDEEDEMLRAVEQVALPSHPMPGGGNLLLVDGFYRFSPAQRMLLAAIARRGQAFGKREVETAVTLPYDADRPLLFAAPARTLQTLRAEFETREQVLESVSDTLPPALVRLEAHLFEVSASDSRTDAAPLTPLASSLRPLVSPLVLFDAPNPYVEAEMTAREFRRIHDAGGYTWSDFAVILRTMGDYAPILSAVFERYGIPLDVDGPENLAENPLLKTLLHLLAVVREGWKRESVVAFLKSSYAPADKLAAESLRRRARAAGVREGKASWLQLVEGEENSVAGTLRDISEWETRLLEECRTASDFGATIWEMVSAFGMDDRIVTGDPVRQQRDRSALRVAADVLKDVEHMCELAGRERLAFDEFHDALLSAWQQTTAIAPLQGDLVRVAEPYDARERPLKAAAVMGLTERVFPRRVTEDPFLRDEERAALREAAGLDLEEQKGRSDDERFFFYLAVTSPAERLILSYPRSSDESDTLPSFYLDEVRAVFPEGVPTISRTLADVAPLPEEVVSDHDRLLAACAGLFGPGAEADEARRLEREHIAADLMRACLENPEQRERTRIVVESRGLPHLPRLDSADLCADFADRKPVFSVSELETYRRCPLQYLFRHVLRMRPETGDGANPQKQGTLLHGILRRYFRRRAGNPRSGEARPTADEMRRDLNVLLAKALNEANMDAGSHYLRITERLLSDSLAGFADREERFSALFGMEPAHFELAFGMGAGGAMLLEDEDREEFVLPREDGTIPPIHDAASIAEPLLLNANDGGPPVAVRGTIDRVDIDAAGQRALVMDYKLSKSVEYAQMQKGDSLQMPLYLMAMERLFGKSGAVGCYDAMHETGRRRIFRTEHVNLRQFAPVIPLEDGTMVKPLNREEYARLVQTAETTAVEMARRIASGSVSARPGEHCRVCPYNDVCRTSRTGEHDGENAL